MAPGPAPTARNGIPARRAGGHALQLVPGAAGRSAARRHRADAALPHIAAFGQSDGTFGTPSTLDSGISGRRAPRSLSTPAVAATVVIAAWSRDDGTTSVIRVVERPAGGSFQHVQTVSAKGARVPAVAIDAGRDRAVAWYRNGYVEAWVGRACGTWGSVLKVAKSAHTPSVPRAAIDQHGRVLLAWAAIDYHQGGSGFSFDAPVRPHDAGWVHRTLQRYMASGFPFSRRPAADLRPLRLGWPRLRRLARARRRPAGGRGRAAGRQ